MTEKPPQDQEDEDGAEAATPQLFRAISGGDPAKQFAHVLSTGNDPRLSRAHIAKTIPLDPLSPEV
jgi:hypothetical protein